MSAHRLEVVVRHVVGDVPSEELRLHVGGAEVEASAQMLASVISSRASENSPTV
jgi:hypothetical protein